MFAVAEFCQILLLYIVAVVFVPSTRHWADNWLTVLKDFERQSFRIFTFKTISDQKIKTFESYRL